MIAGIHILQEIFAIYVFRAIKPSLNQDHKHVLRLLRLYGDQALETKPYLYNLKYMFVTMCLRSLRLIWRPGFGLHTVVMIAGVYISQVMFANGMLTALKPSLEHDRKLVLP